jgi:hypothetical protein
MIAAGDRMAQQKLLTRLEITRSGEGEITSLNVKPAVGFTLPWAGVTPAPSINRKIAKTPFCSQVLFHVAFVLCHPERSRGTRIVLDACRRTLNHRSTAVCDARASSGVCVIQSEAKNPVLLIRSASE